MRNYFILIAAIVCFVQTNAQLNLLNFNKTEKISGEFINNIVATSIIINDSGDVILNWRKILGDSTINKKALVIRDAESGKWFQGKLFNDSNNLCLSSECFFDSLGKLHMLLGERSHNVMNGKSTIKNRLSYFLCENSTWSKTEKVFSSIDDDVKHGFNNIKFLSDKNGKPLLFLIGSRDTCSSQELLMKRKNNNWDSIKSISEAPANFNVYVDKFNRYHMVFIKSARGKGVDMNSVFYFNLNDSGNTFREPVLVHKSGKMAAADAVIAVDKKDIKHIIFSKNLNNNMFPDAIYHSFSKDGVVWSDTIRVSKGVGGNNLNPAVVQDSESNLHLFWEWSPQLFRKPSNILYSKYNGQVWTDPIVVFENSAAPAVTIDKNDFIHIVYKDQSQKETKIYSLVYSKTGKPVIFNNN